MRGNVIDPRSETVLIRNRETGVFEDETRNIAHYEFQDQRIGIVFVNRNKVFSYGPDRAQILRSPVRRIVTGGDRVEVDGSIWDSATETVAAFEAHSIAARKRGIREPQI